MLLWSGELPAAVPGGDRGTVIRFSAPGGYCEAPFSLEVNGGAPDQQLRVTLNGNEPTASRSAELRFPISLTNTTIVRAAVFEGTVRVSPVVTRTYLFLDDVVRQPAAPRGMPAGPRAWNGTPADYAMDPRVVEDPIYRHRLKPALRSLPVLSIVCEPRDLFGQAGLYLNTLNRGTDWEKKCSAELVLTNGESAFQVNCGLRIQGNHNRIPVKSSKHSFRLLFKSEYGPGKLNYRIFPDSTRNKFDTLVLRADSNNAWTHWEPANRGRSQRTRDAWMKDTHRAMGWAAPHNRYFHLFLNGLYWGVYDFTERPDANFAAAYLGGEKEDYDVINEGEVKGGTDEVFNKLRSMRRIQTVSEFDRLRQLLDIPAFIDYTLLNFYAGNEDWGENKNWYAIRSRTGTNTAFRFIVWDGERVLEDEHTDTLRRSYEVPFALRSRIEGFPEYRRAFAERVKLHCLGNGALTPAACAARWMKRAAEVDTAIIAESARWGDSRRREPFVRDREWTSEQRRLIQEFFPQRTGILMKQLKEVGLFSALPRFDAGAVAAIETVDPISY